MILPVLQKIIFHIKNSVVMYFSQNVKHDNIFIKYAKKEFVK